MHNNDAAESNALTRRSFVKIASVSLAGATLFSLPAPALAQTSSNGNRTFVDSLGRNVGIASTIENVTPVGVHAQTLMTTLCPEGLVSLAVNIDSDITDYCEAGIEGLSSLPETGGITSQATEDLAVEEIEIISPELILDVGLPKDGLANELDALQEETGIPVIFLDISFGKLPSAYRALGELLCYRERAEELASYIEKVYDRVQTAASAVATSCNVFYAPRANGLMVKSGLEVQLDAISFVGAVSVTSPYDFKAKTIDFNLLNDEHIDLVVFDDTNCLGSFVGKEGEVYDLWKTVLPVSEGKYAVSPALIHSWFGSIVLVQAIGIQWLSSIIWPDVCNFDILAESVSFYSLFYKLNKDENYLATIIGSYNSVGYNNE